MFNFNKKQSSTADFLEFLNQRYGTKDSDQDGLSDEVELLIGTDPYNKDTDNDGVDDRQEIEQGRNPLGSGKLRDLFVPHAGNNYKPGALQSQRLVFYSLSSLLIKVMVGIFVLTFPMVAWLSPDILYGQSQKIIDLTNQLRVSVGVNQLSINSALTQSAYEKVQDMLMSQYFAHISPDGRSLSDWLKSVAYNYAVAGENLAMGFSQPEEVLAAWQKSPTHYANLIDPDFSEIGVGMVAGAYQKNETVFIAQHFADPSIVTAVQAVEEDMPVVADDNPVETVAMAVSSEQPGTANQTVQKLIQQVLAVNENGSASSTTDDFPRLITPLSGETLGTGEVQLKIWAPENGLLKIYDNDQLLISLYTEEDSDYLNPAIQLAVGEHRLQLKLITEEQNFVSPVYNLQIDQSVPNYEPASTKLVAETLDQNKSWAIMASTVTSDDVAQVFLKIGDYNLELVKQEDDHWEKKAIVYDKSLFDTTVLPALILIDQAGNQAIYDVAWTTVPMPNKLVNKYMFLKANPSSSIQNILDVSSLFYKILLALAIMALGLNIFIAIKKQHPKVIASAVGFIALLVVLIIF
ncbi:MAG: CAP domain-containing protein [bacterium]